MKYKIHPNSLLLFLGFFLSIGTINATLEVRHLVPPQLEDINLGEQITCIRPMRKEGPNMSVESTFNRIIAHNYGHGGSGWTLAPGAAQHVVKLLEKEISENKLFIFYKDNHKKQYKKNFNKLTPVTVIGAGILGLLTALELYLQGFENIQVFAKESTHLTSHNAGGLLAPVSMKNTPEMEKTIAEIGIEAYRFYKKVAEGNHSILKRGATIVPSYFSNREESGLEPYVHVVMEPAKDVKVDFGNGTTGPMVVYDGGIFINPATIIEDLKNFLIKTAKVKFFQREVKNFQEIMTPIIVNCTGLGAKELNNDQKMVPVQGHLIMLKNQPVNLDYMILTYGEKGITTTGKKKTESVYFMPKTLQNALPDDRGAIGGSFIKNAGFDTPHKEEFSALINRVRAFFGYQEVQNLN